jgi:ribosomal protein S8E
MYQAVPVMKTLNVIGVIVAVTIIALAGIAIVAAAAASLLVQSASATTDVMTTTTTSVGGEEQEAVSSTTTNTTNNVSNAVLGDVFMIVEFETASVNPINETYIETSTVNNLTIIPPNATNGTTINATETANVTVNILPNGLALDKGQSLIVTEGDDGGAEQENATTTFVDISRLNPDGSGSGTGVVFFSTNSTGQLAFLDNMVGINDSEFSPGRGTIRVWEWKGGTLPFEIGGGAPTRGNQTTITSALEEEE